MLADVYVGRGRFFVLNEKLRKNSTKNGEF